MNSAGAEQTVVIDKGLGGNWHGDQESELITLTDFGFENGLGGGDLQLVSGNDGEDIFHMVEVLRTDDSCEPPPGPSPTPTPSPTPGPSPTPNPDPYPISSFVPIIILPHP